MLEDTFWKLATSALMSVKFSFRISQNITLKIDFSYQHNIFCC
jgi:hypothetical protein